jgi:hypothetical protein
VTPERRAELEAEDPRYLGGACWKAPTHRHGWIVLADHRLMLVSDPREQGGMAWSDPSGSGQVFYSYDEMRERLKGWTYVGEMHALLRAESTRPAEQPHDAQKEQP